MPDARAFSFAALGPLEVRRKDELIGLAGKERALLGMLLINANATVTRDHLIAALWDEPPRSAVPNLQTYVSGLRRLLATSAPDEGIALRTRAHGYQLLVEKDRLDLLSFADLARHGRQRIDHGDLPGARHELGRAVALSRGRPLEDVSLSDAARPGLTAIEEQVDQAWSEWVEVRLALGDHHHLIGELRSATAARPLRERLWGQLMLALYLAGRRAEALDAYRQVRRILAGQLGIEPGLDLQRLQVAVLNDEPAPAGVRATRHAGAGDHCPAFPAPWCLSLVCTHHPRTTGSS